MTTNDEMPNVIWAGKDDEAEVTFWYQTNREKNPTLYQYHRAQPPIEGLREAIEHKSIPTYGLEWEVVNKLFREEHGMDADEIILQAAKRQLEMEG